MKFEMPSRPGQIVAPPTELVLPPAGGGIVLPPIASPPPLTSGWDASQKLPALAGGLNDAQLIALSDEWLAVGGQWPAVEFQSLPIASPAPAALSVAISPPRVSAFGFQYAEAEAALPALPASLAAPATLPLVARPAAKRLTSRTPIAPPPDLVKLEDRLYYLLQPPIECWMAGVDLHVPENPFPFQLSGVAFLYPRSSAILADEMGLGKTVQAILAIRLLLRSREARRVLVVCPKPLVSNWQRELARWAPEIPLVAIEGDQARRRWQWQLTDAPLLIANYEILVRDREMIAAGTTPFDLVVLDESQRIKNRLSATAEVVRAIPRRRSWALTGTPVENTADDLVGIFEFLMPGYLSPGMKLGRMGRLAGQYVLRRTKEQVLSELPPKLFRDAELELAPAQRETYTMAEERGVLRLTDLGEAATIQHVFELVLRLKQICNFDPATGESAKLDRLAADMEEVAASRQKAIVFSQWVGTLDVLAERLAPYHPLVYHGQIPQSRRGAVLDEFRRDPRRSVLLMSYGAGGVGLNLQFASYVFLFDRWWNPAVEDQAINRAHRIGVERPVTVTRFIALDTIEQRIDQVLRDKREIFETILRGAQSEATGGLSRSDIFGLFRLRAPHDRREAAA